MALAQQARETTVFQQQKAPATHFQEVAARRSVDYVLRTLQQTLVQFSGMGDAKATMMLTVCSIVLTISITQLNSPLLRWPLVILTLFTLVALVLAVLAVIPSRINDGKGLDSASRSFNPLFFGHFASVSMEEYEIRMAAMLESDPMLYEAMVRDIYAQGVVLARKKFRLLRWSYIALLTGAILTVLAAVATIVRS